AVIKKLGDLGFRNAGEVKLQNRMHRKIRNRIFNANAGRAIARSAIGLTTAQLAAEYLDLVFRAVTGNHHKFDHRADDPEVCAAMRKSWGKGQILDLTAHQKRKITEADEVIKETRKSILSDMAKLADNPDDHELRKSILANHDYMVAWVKTLTSRLTPEQRQFAVAMIRA